MACLGAEERARDGGRREHGPSASPQTRKCTLLLSQRTGGQLEAELLDRISHATLLPITWGRHSHPQRQSARLPWFK